MADDRQLAGTATATGGTSAGEPPAKPVAPAKRAPSILDVAEPEKPLPLPEMLQIAARDYGKTLSQMVSEMAKLSFGPGRIGADEYFDLRLFDDKGLAGADKRAFVGMRGSKAIGLAANRNEHWYAIVSDKLTFYTLMTGYGLPTIRQKALYHPSLDLPALGMLKSEEELKRFLTDPANLPLFGKPCNSSLSLGTVAIDGLDGESGRLRLSGGQSADPEKLASDIVANYRTGYMLQEKLVPHPELERLVGSRIGTIRVYTICGRDGPEVFRVCWKVPAGANMADNYWRKGNMLAALDVETGEIRRVIRGYGLNQTEIESHPDTGERMVGARIPGWNDILKLALWGAKVVNHVPLIGWDIAQTARGPVLVEANNTPDFRLVEMAERRGVLDERLKGFLEHMKGVYERAEARHTEKLKGLRRRHITKVFDSIKRPA
ncbi:MAG: sugar-transfer associated ATP-grasp domain-containing protein [Hyphomicrobiaceae bacterium]